MFQGLTSNGEVVDSLRNHQPAVTVQKGVMEQSGPGHDENAHDAYRQAVALLNERRPIEAAQVAAPLEQAEVVPEAFLEVLAQAYFASAQLGNAERVLRRLIDQAPANGWAHRALARTLQRRNAGDEAARYHRLADGFGVA